MAGKSRVAHFSHSLARETLSTESVDRPRKAKCPHSADVALHFLGLKRLSLWAMPTRNKGVVSGVDMREVLYKRSPEGGEGAGGVHC